MFDLGKAMFILLRRAPIRLTRGLRSHGCIKLGLLGECGLTSMVFIYME